MRNGVFICIVISVIQSCNNQSVNIDAIIEKYNTTDFTGLKNKSIYFRSAGNSKNSSIYFVNAYDDGNCSPYAVEINNDNQSIVEIKNDLVLLSCGNDYLTKEEIGAAIKKYMEYHFCLLQVDKEGDVYINPDSQGLPTLLRKAKNSNPKDINKFKLYKGNWYIRKG